MRFSSDGNAKKDGLEYHIHFNPWLDHEEQEAQYFVSIYNRNNETGLSTERTNSFVHRASAITFCEEVSKGNISYDELLVKYQQAEESHRAEVTAREDKKIGEFLQSLVDMDVDPRHLKDILHGFNELQHELGYNQMDRVFDGDIFWQSVSEYLGKQEDKTSTLLKTVAPQPEENLESHSTSNDPICFYVWDDNSDHPQNIQTTFEAALEQYKSLNCEDKALCFETNSEKGQKRGGMLLLHDKEGDHVCLISRKFTSTDPHIALAHAKAVLFVHPRTFWAVKQKWEAEKAIEEAAKQPSLNARISDAEGRLRASSTNTKNTRQQDRYQD